MGSFRLFRKQTGRMVVTIGLLTATIVPSFMPALASAAEVSDRSIELSSSSKKASDVTYDIKFKAITAAGAFAVWFCSNSPSFDDACTAPGGFSLGAPSSTSSGFTDVSAPSANKLVVAGTMTANTAVEVAVDHITNPDDAGALYARIATYADKTTATAATADGAGSLDEGSVAMSITDSVSVQGRVLESLIFCVSGVTNDTTEGANPNPIEAGCTGTHMTTPTLKLGEPVGDTLALTSDHVSFGDIYTQISTNASGGAAISLKSLTDCGGMKRLGASVCDIAPAQKAGISDGDALFGLKVAPDATSDTAQGASGTLEADATSGYNASTYVLNYASDNQSGVTSVYGDPLLDTNGTQPMNRNMKLTFGASVANNTPGGTYNTSLDLVATGKF